MVSYLPYFTLSVTLLICYSGFVSILYQLLTCVNLIQCSASLASPLLYRALPRSRSSPPRAKPMITISAISATTPCSVGSWYQFVINFVFNLSTRIYALMPCVCCCSAQITRYAQLNAVLKGHIISEIASNACVSHLVPSLHQVLDLTPRVHSLTVRTLFNSMAHHHTP